MFAARSIIFGLALGSPQAWASDKEVSDLVSNFAAICVQELPSTANAIERARERGFVALYEGAIPELDPVLRSEPEWDHFVGRLGENSLLTLRFAEKSIEESARGALGANTASLCEMGVLQSTFNMSHFAEALSEHLRLGQPVLDIVNSGRREMVWNIYVAYNTSTLMLKEVSDSAPYGFSVALAVPQQN